MMKHGLIVLALLCWLAGGLSAETPPLRVALTLQELEAVDGGDLFLSVDRDRQMMTVTRVTPGNYDNIQCFSVGVTTSVVRNKDVTPEVPKNSMQNNNRELTSRESSLIPKGETRTPTQFPSGTANVLPVVGTQSDVAGPVVRTDATQMVNGTDAAGNPIRVPDSGYNIHYVDPSKSTNTLGCIGVQSRDGMDRVAEALRTDTAGYPPGAVPNQTVSVSSPSPTPPPQASPSPAPSPSKTIYPPKGNQIPHRPL